MSNQVEQFCQEYRLTSRWCAQLFGVSPRTLRRWRRRGRMPRHAENMVEVVREQQAPINHSLPRGPWIGVQIYSWRERLFGPSWRDWRAPERVYPSLAHRRRRPSPGERLS